MTGATCPATDFVLPELMQLATARAEMDRHRNDHGRCAACQMSFPCERAVLADLVLSVL